MRRTLFFGLLLACSAFLSGCVGYPGCGPYGNNGLCGSYSPGMYNNYSDCGNCGDCSNCGIGGGGCLQSLGCGAGCAVATPISWVAQILRGTNYPCHGCGDEVYWGDYGLTPNDYCDPCTNDGVWAGDVGGNTGACGYGKTCQGGLSYKYPAIGNSLNQAYAPVFQDKIAATHARTPLDYGFKGPGFYGCGSGCGLDSCDYGSCGTDMCGVSSGCSTGCSTGSSYGTGTVGRPISSGSRSSSCNCGSNGNHNHMETVEPSYIEGDGTPAEPITTTSARRQVRQQPTRLSYPTPTLGKQTYR